MDLALSLGCIRFAALQAFQRGHRAGQAAIVEVPVTLKILSLSAWFAWKDGTHVH